MSDLRNLSVKELERREIACGSQMKRLQDKLYLEKTRMRYIKSCLVKARKQEVTALVAKLMKG